MRTKWRGWLATGAVAAVLVAGCGSAGSTSGTVVGAPAQPTNGGEARPDSAQQPNVLIADAVAKAVAAENAKIAIEVGVSGSGQSFEATGDGVVDFADQAFALTVTEPMTGQDIEVRQIDQMLYLRLPPMAGAALGISTPWVSLTPEALAGAAGAGGGLGAAGQSDPAALLRMLEAISTDVTEVGRQDVRGVPTTQYRAAVDLARAAEVSGADPSVVEQYERQFGETLPLDVYLDDDGLVRRIAVDVAAQAGGSDDVRAVVDYYDYGAADAAVEAPPADEVTDGSELLAILGGMVPR